MFVLDIGRYFSSEPDRTRRDQDHTLSVFSDDVRNISHEAIDFF